MGQLEVQDGGGASNAAKDSTAGQRRPIPSTAKDAGTYGGGGAQSAPKDTTRRGAPSSTGSPDPLDASNQV